MTPHKITIKLFVESDTFAPSEFTPIFHHWIQNQSLANHFLIDVADYAHVPAGPGSVIIAAEANIHMDRAENQLGLLYVRKQPIPDAPSFQDQLRGTLAETFEAAAKLESEPEVKGRLKFRTNEIAIRLNDRLLAPNNSETLAKFRAEIESTAKALFGSVPIAIEHHNPSPLALFELRLKPAQSQPLFILLSHLTAAT